MKNHTKKQKVTELPINLRKIREHFGFKHKLPKNFTFEGEIEVFANWNTNKSLGLWFVKVIPAQYQGKPRIFLGYEGRHIPAGRTAQANA